MKSASTPAGRKSFGFAALDGGEQALHAFGGIGAMRKNFFERILAGFQARSFGAQLIEDSAGLPPRWALRTSSSSSTPALAVGGGFQLHLPRGHLSRQIRLHRLQPLQIRRGGLFFALAARRIALDGGQILADLHQLVLQRRSFAQQTQHDLASGLERSGAILQSLLELFPLGALTASRSRADSVCASSSASDCRCASSSCWNCCLPFLQLLRFRFALRQPLFDGADLLGLRIQLAARALLLQLQIGQLLPRLRQLGVVAIAGFLKLSVFFLALGYLIRKILEFRVREIQIQRGFGRFALQHPVAAGQRSAQMRDHLGLQFFVAARLGGLALERIHLPAHFFQNVEHARKILFGAFQLRFRQPLLGFEFADRRPLLR